jgi:hypothetical protein
MWRVPQADARDTVGSPFDRIDGVEHGGVDKRHHPLSQVWVGASKIGHCPNGSDAFFVPIGYDVGEC